MKKVSMTDIANRAQVSLGTVSNVLNNKGNVRIETIRKVEEAVKALNYIPNDNAQSMRTNESNIILFFIPELHHTLDTLLIDLTFNLEQYNLELKIVEINHLADFEVINNQISQRNYRLVLCLASIAQHEIIKAIPQEKMLIIGQSNINTNEITYNIDSLVNLPVDLKQYSIVTETDNFTLSEIISESIYDHTQVKLNRISSLTESDITQLRHFIVFSVVEIENILSYVPKEKYLDYYFILLTTYNGYLFQHTLNVHKLYLSSNKLALKIVKGIRKLKDEPNKLYQSSVHFHSTNLKELPAFKTHKKLKLLLLDNPFAKGLKQIAHKFTHQTNLILDFHTHSFDELNTIINEDRINQYDLVRLDVSYFPWQAENLFLDLTNEKRIKKIQQTLPLWKNYSFINKKLLALPADPSIQMMLSRNDVFNNPIIQKSYAEHFNTALKVPSTFEEMVDFVKFYHTLNAVDQPVPYPIAMNNGSAVLLASEFLPYFYSIGGSILVKNDQLVITTDAFIQTLKNYRKSQANALILKDHWWDSEIEQFNQNQTALIICYTNHLNQINLKNYNYHTIPGSSPAYGGGVIGITKDSKNKNESITFLEWLNQYQIQEDLSALGVGVSRTHLFDERYNHRKYPFLSYANNNFSKGRRLQFSNSDYVLNTIEIERIIGQEILRGIRENISDVDILLQIHSHLNTRKEPLFRKL